MPIKPCRVNGEQFFSEKGANEVQLCQLSPCIPGEQGTVWQLLWGCPVPPVQLCAGSSAVWGTGKGAEK